MEVQINSERFYHRLGYLIENWTTQRITLWGGSDALCVSSGSKTEDTNYSKSAALQLYLFGYEIPDSIIVITRNSFWFMASDKKIKLIAPPLINGSPTITFNTLERSKDSGLNRERFMTLINVVRKSGGNKIGSLFKAEYPGTLVPAWHEVIDQSQLDKIDIAASLGLLLSVKDASEIDLCRRAAVLSNKVMKHGFVSEMESILDNDSKIKHDDLANKVEGIIYDPSKIGLKVSAEAVNSCFTPIIQSGGVYDIRVSGQSNSEVLTPDVIICSLGAKYKEYCANISRTFMVDAPAKVEQTYATLLALHTACLEQMSAGNEFKDVVIGARAFLAAKAPTLLAHLPKTLGFAIGLQFRDNTLILNDKSTTKFVDGMIVNLVVGFQNVPLSAEDKQGASASAQKLNEFSLLIADTVCVMKDALPDVLTKLSKEFSDVSYNLSDDKAEEEEEDEDVEGDDGEGGDAKEARDLVNGVRRSTRKSDEKATADQAASMRGQRQAELMKKRLAEARRRMSKGGNGRQEEEENEKEAKELEAYKSTEAYPRDVLPNQVRVDLDKETLILPINGRPVPFHISTIKNVTRPDEDPNKATWMRVNFFIPGSAGMKDVPKNMQQLIVKYGSTQSFIKEMTFRSLDSHNLHQQYQLFLELRKRVKQREQKAEQEKDLVVQQRLVRIKDQRVPRLQDLTIRPSMSGRKCVGTVEAHQNGLRFNSNKAEILDVMYANIKRVIYQPCDKTTMVLVHFHLKDFIMVGKKKQKDIQFYTEVIDSSLNLDNGKRSHYDIDELDEEQRERELRKRLNLTFKDFCLKFEKVASHYGYSLQVDVPFRKSGFEGNCNKEMVFLQPTTHCLVNLTEVPAFVLTLSDIEHAHFERVTYTTKNFDLTFIFKNWDLPPRTITVIDMKYMDTIQDWLNLVEITYTVGARSMNWNDTMIAVRASADHFYLDVDAEGEKQAPGWLLLSGEGDDEAGGEEDSEGDDESFSGGDAGDGESSSDDSGSSDSDVASDGEDDDSDDDEDEEEDDDSDQDREAEASDKIKRQKEQLQERSNKMQKRR